MDINDLTIGEAKELSRMFGGQKQYTGGIDDFSLGEVVIIRTFSAGVWCGKLIRKSSEEVILADARRMWKWKAVKGISLSEVSQEGIVQKESRIAAAVPMVWLKAIEIIPVAGNAKKLIMEAPNAHA